MPRLHLSLARATGGAPQRAPARVRSQTLANKIAGRAIWLNPGPWHRSVRLRARSHTSASKVHSS
eukprot:3967875-Alexandrium_andersonii.AAC.1